MIGERIDLIPAELRDYIDQAIETAKEIAADSERIEAVAIIRNSEQSMIFPIAEMGNPILAASFIRGLAEQMDATSIFIATEAWMTPERAKQPNVQIKDTPGRRDVVFFHVETEIGIWCADTDIEPHDENAKKPRQFETPFFHVAESTGGLFSRMLPQRPEPFKH